MQEQPKREIWFETRIGYRGPIPIHWKGCLCYLLLVPAFATLFYLQKLETVLGGFFPVLLLFLVFGGGGIAVFWMLVSDHLNQQDE